MRSQHSHPAGNSEALCHGRHVTSYGLGREWVKGVAVLIDCVA